MQTKRQTLIEIGAGTATGFAGSWLITYLIVQSHAFSAEAASTVIVALRTIWSFVRGYSLRRLFNRLHSNQDHTA